MQFATQRELSLAYLILRHIYDGDIIEWPIPEAHAHAAIFAALEQQGYIARWDRTWPKADRYRLTEQGIAAIEKVYKPAGAETVWNSVRAAKIPPAQRRKYIQDTGYDPYLWSLLHDPSTQWDSYEGSGRWLDYFYEDERPGRRTRHDVLEAPDPEPPPQSVLVDLDAQAQHQALEANLVELPQSDYDVS